VILKGERTCEGERVVKSGRGGLRLSHAKQGKWAGIQFLIACLGLG